MLQSFLKKFARNEPSKRDIELSDGITVRNIPNHLEIKSIFEFLLKNGLPEDHGIDQIRINKGDKNTWAIIEGLNSTSVLTMYNNIHYPVSQKKFYEVPIYCNPLRNSTPQKVSTPSKDNISNIPGLSKEDQKKALKKAKQKLKAGVKKGGSSDELNQSSMVNELDSNFDFEEANIFQKTDSGSRFSDYMKRMSGSPSCSKTVTEVLQENSESSPDVSYDLRKQSAILQQKCLGKRLLSPEEQSQKRVQKLKSK